MAVKPEIDDVTGVETTGHEWDGLKELNKPLPSWWVWTFWATFIWAIAYWIAYPAWPLLTDYTPGVLGFSSRAAALEEVKAGQEKMKPFNDELAKTSFADLEKKPDLMKFAVNSGKTIFGDNCAPCHGAKGAGGDGYPILADDDWIWGGKIDRIEHIITHGARSGTPEQRDSTMPAFGKDGILKENEISDVADYVLSLSGTKGDEAAIGRGKALFADNCASCHTVEGKGDGTGNPELGAPNLTNKIWLYGGTKKDIVAQINNPRMGEMPAWGGRLDANDPAAIKKVAAYICSLGGCEK